MSKTKESDWKEQGAAYELRSEEAGLVCYLSRPDRGVYSAAFSLLADKKMLEAGELVVRRCWVGGDEAAKQDPAICLKAVELLDVTGAALKKL